MRTFGTYLPLIFAVAFLGLAPILHSHRLNDPVLYPQLLGIAVLAAAFAILLLRQSKEPKPFSMQAIWPLGILALLSALSSLWALNPAEAWFSSARWMIALAFVIVCQSMLAREPATLLQICKVLIVSMSGYALIGMFQSVGWDPLGLSDAHQSPVGLQANRNFYGTALFLGIPFAAYALFKLPRPWKVAATLAIGLMITGIIVASTRAALVPLILAAAIVPPIAIIKRLRGHTRLISLAVWALLIVTSAWSTQFVLGKKEANPNLAFLWEDGHLVTPKTSSLEFRLISWHHTLALAQEKPLLGHGAGNWKMQVQRLGLQSYDDKGNYGIVVPLHPHNEFLAVLAELGVPGLLVLLAVWGIGIWGACRMAFKPNAENDRMLGVCLLVAWLGITVDWGFSFPLERPLHLMLLGLVLALSGKGFPMKQIVPAQQRGMLGIAFALCLLAGIDVSARLLVDANIREVRDEKLAHHPAKVLQLAPKASNWATQLDPVAALSVEWYVAMAQLESGQLQAALAAFERSAKISPHHLAQRSGYAGLLDMMGRSAEAIDLQTALLETFPNYCEGRVNLSIMQIHAGRLIEARATLNEVPRADVPILYDKVDQVLKEASH